MFILAVLALTRQRSRCVRRQLLPVRRDSGLHEFDALLAGAAHRAPHVVLVGFGRAWQLLLLIVVVLVVVVALVVAAAEPLGLLRRSRAAPRCRTSWRP